MDKRIRALFKEIINAMPVYGPNQYYKNAHKLAYYRIPIAHLNDARAVVAKYRPQLRELRVRVAYEWIGPRPATRFRDEHLAMIDLIANGPRLRAARQQRCLKEFATGFSINFYPGLG